MNFRITYFVLYLLQITGIDHLVLTVQDINETVIFYSRVLGFSVSTFGDGRLALKFGEQKINLHLAGKEYKPHAQVPTPGSADLCFVTTTSISEWTDYLTQLEIPIVDGPVERTGANGPLLSLYIRDPDLNLIEIGCYQ